MAGGENVQAGFNPYQENEGTVMAVAGEDFVTVCTDTRISSGYSILKRNHSKTTTLTKTCIITSGGMVADIDALHKNLLTRIRVYVMQNKREPTAESIAKLLSNTLYGRRFMPFYAFNLLCGLDATSGEGIIYGYDAIGSYQPVNYGCLGSGRELGISVLDN